jgi:RNA polymerase sigma-70 factor (ECF subfamily)
MTDDEVIRAVLEGDREAFRLLVERYAPMARSFAARLLGHSQDAEDACQEAFVAAFRFLYRFDRGAGAFSTWLLTIIRHRCLNHVRREVRHKSQTDIVEVAEDAVSPLEVAVTHELEQKIDAALVQLPWEQRTAFVLLELHGLSVAEVARVEDVSEGTIKSRASRARGRLRKLLPEYQPREVVHETG